MAGTNKSTKTFIVQKVIEKVQSIQTKVQNLFIVQKMIEKARYKYTKKSPKTTHDSTKKG